MSVLGVCIEGGLPREGVCLEAVFLQTKEGLPYVLFLWRDGRFWKYYIPFRSIIIENSIGVCFRATRVLSVGDVFGGMSRWRDAVDKERCVRQNASWSMRQKWLWLHRLRFRCPRSGLQLLYFSVYSSVFSLTLNLYSKTFYNRQNNTPDCFHQMVWFSIVNISVMSSS